MATAYDNLISPVRQLVDIPLQKKVGNVSLKPVDGTETPPTKPIDTGVEYVPPQTSGGGLFPVTGGPVRPTDPVDTITPVGQTDGYGNTAGAGGDGATTVVGGLPQSGQVVDGKPSDTTPDYSTGPQTPPTKPVDNGTTTPPNPIPPPLTTTPPVQTLTPAQQAMQQTQGLFETASANAPKAPVVQTPTAVPTTSVPSGYTPGAANPALANKAAPTVNYDPRQEALVANQLEALMDPNSPVNRKAMAIAQQISAQRGLQSSSIAAEAGTSALIDSARQIAAQDASTYATMQGQNQQYQQNWNLNKDNQQFQSGENVLNRAHESQMFDKNAALQSSLLNTQLSFQAGENAANRSFQAQMQELQHKQQLGVLSAQQQAQLVQMERNAQLTGERDKLLQDYNKELTVINNDQRWKETLFQADTQFQQLSKQFDQQTKLTYANSQTQLMTEMMSAIGNAMTNPNMTAAQQQAMVDQIRSTFSQQASALAVVFGAKAPTGTQPGASIPGISDPTNTGPTIGINPVTGPGGTDQGLFLP